LHDDTGTPDPKEGDFPMYFYARFAGAFALVLLVGIQPTQAIEELEVEEDIADLLPNTFPDNHGRDNAKRHWAVLPQLGYGPDTGGLVGIKFADRNAGAGTTIDLGATYAMNQQQELVLSLGAPHLIDDNFLVVVRAKYYMDPQRDFFGLGNNNVGPKPASTHKFQDLGGALTVGWRATEQLAVNVGVEARQVDIRRGTRLDHTPFTLERFPDLPGIEGGLVNPFALSLVWNTRDSVVRPTHGWRVIAKALHTNKSLLSDFEFTRFVVDAGYLRSFRDGRQVIGVRADAEYIVAPKGQVPFWELCELGGQDTLRGFFPHRFVGKGRGLINLEGRSRLTEFDFFKMWKVRLDGVIFGDAGRVYLDRNDVRSEYRLNGSIFRRVVQDLQYSYGAGLRIALSEALVARIDAGFSEEETGLVYLSFGQTF